MIRPWRPARTSYILSASKTLALKNSSYRYLTVPRTSKQAFAQSRSWPWIATTATSLGISIGVYASYKTRTLQVASSKDAKQAEPDTFADKSLDPQEKNTDSWSLPSVPIPSLPSLPSIPSLPSMSLPSIPSLPSFPSPSFDLPSWVWPESLVRFRASVDSLLLELSGGEGSLYHRIATADPDPSISPECQWDAEVRIGDDLPISEKAFLHVRRRRMKTTFAQLIGVDPEDVDERDIPTVAIAASGGGLRAAMNTIGALKEFQESKLFDCITYVAGISGSCWAMAALYSGVAGNDPASATGHLKSRIQVPYVDSSALELLTSPPTNEYLLSGIIRKATMPNGTVSLTDIYGTLVSSRILVPDDISKLDPTHLSLHHFRRNIDNGALPMPIFTAISRELPEELLKKETKVKDETTIAVDSFQRTRLEASRREIEDEARWLWFEFTPFETGCDEIGAWIPSWALGRTFNRGKSQNRVPEVSFTILTGVFASAFCASLKVGYDTSRGSCLIVHTNFNPYMRHYYVEVETILQQLPPALFGWVSKVIADSDTDFDTVHPIVPNGLPNYLKGLQGELRSGVPSHLTELETLGFMDAGAELNIPYYPLFRREVDCVIALDASADSQDLWFTKAEKFALRRGLSTWPRGARWPSVVEAPEESETNGAPNTTTPQEPTPRESAARKLAEAQESEAAGQQMKQESTKKQDLPSSSNSSNAASTTVKPPNDSLLSGRTGAHLWIGSSSDNDEAVSFSSNDEIDEEALATKDGIGILYFPLISNDAVPNFNPLSISTWRFELTADESDKLLATSSHNARSGQDMIVKVLRAMWLRKRRNRLKNESDATSSEFASHDDTRL